MLHTLRDPRGLALGRTAVGVTMLTRPALVPAALGVPEQSQEAMAWAMQMLGAREVALGVGSLAAGKDGRLWLAAGLLSDAVDAVAVGSALRQGRVRAVPGVGAVIIAVVAAVTGADALRASGRRSRG